MTVEPEDDNPVFQSSWFDEFSRMADKRLGDGSACAQIHPIIEAWFVNWLNQEPPSMRGSIAQGLSCLTTEVLNVVPKSILDALMEHCDQDEVADWIEHVLGIGKAFQQALDRGELDDI